MARIVEGMGRSQAIIAAALGLAGQSWGTTAAGLAETASCSLRTAQRTLAKLAEQGLLAADVPARKGMKRGERVTTYTRPGRRLTRYDVHVRMEGRGEGEVRRLVSDLLPGHTVTVSRPNVARSRSERLAHAQGLHDDAVAEVEELCEELRSWREGLPDSFQDGAKAEALDAAIEALEGIASSLQEVDFDTVEFPGMYS